ncbi:TPA: hypothetical protein AB5E57_001658 [Vibrio cholerae]
MSYGVSFFTNNGRQFQLDQIQPGVYLGTVTLSGSASFSFPELNGQAEIYAELLSRTYRRSGDGRVSSIVQYSYSRPARGQIVINFQNVGVASFSARFSLFARFR